MDIFPLDKISDNNHSYITKIGRENILLTRANVKNKNDSLKKRVVRLLLKLIPSNIRQKKLKNNTRILEEYSKRIKKNYKWISMSTLENIKNIRFSQNRCENYTELLFEGIYFMAFSKYDELLTDIYGDYMKLPPVEEQVCKHNPVKINF